MSSSFVQLSRDPKVDELMKVSPAGFLLATQIARRARRTTAGLNPHALNMGEALIGDHRSIGLSEREYRTAKSHLEKWQIATFKATNKGTIAILMDSSIYDINAEASDEQKDRQATGKRRLTKNGKNGNKSLPPSDDGQEDDQPDETQPDPRFMPVTEGYCAAYLETFGSPYVHGGGKDGRKVKLFLAAANPAEFSAERIVKVAKAAMRHSRTQFAKAAKLATSLGGFCEHFNVIRAEVIEVNGTNGTAQPRAPDLRDGIDPVAFRRWLAATYPKADPASTPQDHTTETVQQFLASAEHLKPRR